jgi:hypothetical protein
MESPKLKSSQINRHAILRDVLADAARTVPEARRTPSLMACLAEKILALAADGEADPVNLRRRAIERVRDSCSGCRACDGLQLARHSHLSPLAS